MRGLPRPLAGLALIALWPTAARAHGMVALGDFYGGLLDPFLHFETALPLVAAALWAAQQGSPVRWWLVGVLLAAAAAGAAAGLGAAPAPGAAQMVSLLGMLLSGIAVATAWRPRAGVAVAIVAAVTTAAGWGAALEAAESVRRPALWVLGAGVGAGLLGFHVADQLERWRAFWLDIAVRVLGSWIAAVGLLVGALRMAPGRGG